MYDTGEDMIGDTSIPYIVMEYVDGSTLRDLLRENRALMPDKALEITDGSCARWTTATAAGSCTATSNRPT